MQAGTNLWPMMKSRNSFLSHREAKLPVEFIGDSLDTFKNVIHLNKQ
jgi:hypothetical protein